VISFVAMTDSVYGYYDGHCPLAVYIFIRIVSEIGSVPVVSKDTKAH
jgi:hypothetical protein